MVVAPVRALDDRAGVGFSVARAKRPAERPWAKAGAVQGNMGLALILELPRRLLQSFDRFGFALFC